MADGDLEEGPNRLRNDIPNKSIDADAWARRSIVIEREGTKGSFL